MGKIVHLPKIYYKAVATKIIWYCCKERKIDNGKVQEFGKLLTHIWKLNKL